MNRVILTALAALVSAGTAAGLITTITAEESGRTVEAIAVEPAAKQPAAVEIVRESGRQHLRAYRDIAGVWTICDGITRGVRAGDVETPAGCLRRLEEEVVVHARGVLTCVPGLRAAARERQRLASISLAFNIGVTAFCGSTAARRFRAGEWRRGCDAMLAWNKARVGGQLRVVRGLQRRRERERAICLQGL